MTFHLTKTEFKLLVELASQPGKVFSREVLLERVWGYDYFGDGRLVDVHVRFGRRLKRTQQVPVMSLRRGAWATSCSPSRWPPGDAGLGLPRALP
ncbi:MAG: winged helix-turn-helix domain-containing protein [Acidimicrobiales bacterium]